MRVRPYLFAAACAMLALLPQWAQADADALLGVDTATGIPEVLTPQDASVLLGGGGGGGAGLDANFDVSGGNLITGADETKKFTIYGSTGQTTSGVVLYRLSSGKTIIRCVEAGVEGNCDVSVELITGKVWKVTNNGGTVIFQIDESTGKVSKFTANAEDAGIALTLYAPLCGGDLAGVDPASGSAGHIWDKDSLSTAPTAVAVTGTNQSYGVARFPDSDGDYGVQLTCLLPPGFTGQLDAVAWGKTTGTGNVVLQLATKCYASDEASDAAFNTASAFTLAAGTSGRLNRYAMSNVTITGCAGNELMALRIFRNRTHGSDTLTSTFDLKSVRLWARTTY